MDRIKQWLVARAPHLEYARVHPCSAAHSMLAGITAYSGMAVHHTCSSKPQFREVVAQLPSCAQTSLC